MKKIVLALILIEQFAAMTEICKSRLTCIGCPYRKDNACDMVSTRRAISVIGSVSREYLYSEGYYPMTAKEFEQELKNCYPQLEDSSILVKEYDKVNT